MGNRPQLAQQLIQAVIAEQQRITTTKQDITNLRVLADISNGLGKVGMQLLLPGTADHAAAGAITTVRGTAVSYQKQNPIGIAMNQAGNRHVIILATGIDQFPRRGGHFLDTGNDLAPDGAFRIGAINQVEEIGGDSQSQFVSCFFHALPLFWGQCDQGLQCLKRGQPVTQLPAPVVPVFG